MSCRDPWNISLECRHQKRGKRYKHSGNAMNIFQILCVGLALASGPRQETPIRAGLSYSPAFRVLLTARQYIVPFILRFRDVQKPLIKARNMTANIAWNVNHMNSSYRVVSSLQKTLRNFDAEFQKMFVDMNDFLEYLIGRNPYSEVRSKRGALNFMGSLSNMLFGTATQDQIDTIHNKLQAMEILSEKERNMLNLHSSTLNMTIRNMRSMRSALSRLEQASSLSHKIIREFSIRTLQIEGEQRMTEALMNLELALIDISNDHMNIKLGLEEMLQTHVSPMIVPNTILLSLLKAASVRLPGLLFPALPEYLSLYRQAIRVTSRPTTFPRSYNFYITIPLRGDPADIFDVFQIDSLPYQVPHTDSFVYYKAVKKYLAMSENRNKYFLINDFDHCRKHDNLYICPPLGPVYDAQVDTCESALFLNKPAAANLCKPIYTKSFSPIFIHNQGTWVFSTSTPLTLTLNCPTNPVSKMQQVVNGTGLISLGRGCSAHSQVLILPAHDTAIRQEPLTVSRVPLAVEVELRPSDRRLLDALSNVSSFNRNILDHDSTSYQEYLDRLQPVPAADVPQTPGTPVWIFILAGVGLGLVLLVSCVVNLWVLRRARQSLTREALQITTMKPRSVRPQGRVLLGEEPCGTPNLTLRAPAELSLEPPLHASGGLINLVGEHGEA